jgi:A/G-specific adenine glycosylase
MQDRPMIRSVPVKRDTLEWVRTNRLSSYPLTGLARKVLQRLEVMDVQKVRLEGFAEEDKSEDDDPRLKLEW